MITAKITPEAAFDVAAFLVRMIPAHASTQDAVAWQEVVDALYALSNDADAIVADDVTGTPDALVALERLEAEMQRLKALFPQVTEHVDQRAVDFARAVIAKAARS